GGGGALDDDDFSSPFLGRLDRSVGVAPFLPYRSARVCVLVCLRTLKLGLPSWLLLHRSKRNGAARVCVNVFFLANNHHKAAKRKTARHLVSKSLRRANNEERMLLDAV
uniref:Uncharacterized protein n=1 Tax=Anopheles dirus TaxID=7168 RepID=A0A182NYT1_9DIPT